MNLNTSNLSHYRTQWEIEAAMWRAVELSRRGRGVGIAKALAKSGSTIISVLHDRQAVPAFSFWRDGFDVTESVVKALREFASENM